MINLHALALEQTAKTVDSRTVKDFLFYIPVLGQVFYVLGLVLGALLQSKLVEQNEVASLIEPAPVGEKMNPSSVRSIKIDMFSQLGSSMLIIDAANAADRTVIKVQNDDEFNALLEDLQAIHKSGRSFEIIFTTDSLALQACGVLALWKKQLEKEPSDDIAKMLTRLFGFRNEWARDQIEQMPIGERGQALAALTYLYVAQRKLIQALGTI